MALVDEYEAAVRGGNTKYANYLAQILASGAGININANEVTAAPSALLSHGDPTPAGDGNFWGGLSSGVAGLQSGVAGLLGAIDSIDPTAPKGGGKGPLSSVADLLGGVSDAVSGTSAALKFITDIPRVVTTLLGLILIIAGIFALAKGPAIQVLGALKP